MNDDQELKRMFAAARVVDSESVPPFDELTGESHFSNEGNLQLSPVTARMAVTVVGVVMAALFVAFLRPGKPIASSRPAVTQSLDQICNSLVDRLSVNDSEKGQPSFEEMRWTTRTDSLLTFDTVRFDEGETR